MNFYVGVRGKEGSEGGKVNAGEVEGAGDNSALEHRGEGGYVGVGGKGWVKGLGGLEACDGDASEGGWVVTGSSEPD